MRKNIFILLLWLPTLVWGRGLRHSVCQVAPEYSAEEQNELRDLALQLSRVGQTAKAQFIQAITHPGYYGSGVAVSADKAYILTSHNAVGYAQTATITIYLHDKTLVYRGCRVIGTDTLSGTALISMPESEDIDPLSLREIAVEDGDEIRSAGYSIWTEHASWQLVKGAISNAYLQRNGCRYLQHTAPFNVGMAGGPLLHKTDSGYVVIGINIGKIRSRDEVAMAVPASTIERVLASDSLLSGKQMLQPLQEMILSLLPKAKKKADEKALLAKRATTRGITADVSHFRQNFFYHNYLSSKNMEAGLGMEFALDKQNISYLGMQFACSWMEARPVDKYPTIDYAHHTSGYLLFDPKSVFTPLFGLYLGAQLPLRVAPKHVLVPRLSQGGNIGPCLNQYDEVENRYSVGAFLITSDSRLSLEYHYQLEKIDLIWALEYTAHISASKAEVCWRYQNNTKAPEPIDPHTRLLIYNQKNDNLRYTCLNHGLGVRFAIGFGH